MDGSRSCLMVEVVKKQNRVRHEESNTLSNCCNFCSVRLDCNYATKARENLDSSTNESHTHPFMFQHILTAVSRIYLFNLWLLEIFKSLLIHKKRLHGLSPRANYTDRATATCRRSDCQLLRIEGVTWSA
jgi:hypothetical protein